LDRKAEEPVVLDLRGRSDVTDFFLICHGNSDRQVRAIAESIEERLVRDLGRRPSHVEGRGTFDWILMDYVDFVVHIFRDDRRQFYRLERLWGDAPSVDLSGMTSAARDMETG
jgi:ribosome-associated protein